MITFLPLYGSRSWRFSGGTGSVKAPLAFRRKSSPSPSMTASKKFIAGLPMKPATKRLRGRSYSSCGVPTCWIAPRCWTTIRVAIVIASVWSCVT